MFRKYSPSATEPSPSVPLWIAFSRGASLPTFTRALTRYRILPLSHLDLARLMIPAHPPAMLQRQVRHLHHQRRLERNPHRRRRRLPRPHAVEEISDMQVRRVPKSPFRLLRDRRHFLRPFHVALPFLPPPSHPPLPASHP